jgi:hypothetical protein
MLVLYVVLLPHLKLAEANFPIIVQISSLHELDNLRVRGFDVELAQSPPDVILSDEAIVILVKRVEHCC